MALQQHLSWSSQCQFGLLPWPCCSPSGNSAVFLALLQAVIRSRERAGHWPASLPRINLVWSAVQPVASRHRRTRETTWGTCLEEVLRRCDSQIEEQRSPDQSLMRALCRWRNVRVRLPVTHRLLDPYCRKANGRRGEVGCTCSDGFAVRKQVRRPCCLTATAELFSPASVFTRSMGS